jgi:hypothetical protein
MERIIPTIRHIFAELTERSSPRLSQQEKKYLSLMKILDHTIPAIRFFPLKEIAKLLTIPNRDISKITQAFPCTNPTNRTNADSCGINKYCDNCFQAISLLGNSWHFEATSAFITAALANMLERIPTQTTHQLQPIHRCTDNCSLATTAQTIRSRMTKASER